MVLGRYFPSAQFILIVVSIALSGGLVLAAERYTSKHENPGELTSAEPSADSADWKVTLDDIQAQSGISLPEPPSKESVAQLLAAAKEGNVTEGVSRTLLINLTDAASQGLGSDIPTQERLISLATAQLQSSPAAGAYTTGDLSLAQNSKDDLHAYGNLFMLAVQSHSGANIDAVLRAIGAAVDNNDAAQLQKLGAMSEAYDALAAALLAVPTPQTLAPIHLQIVNDLARAAKSIRDMKSMFTDPLLGIAGLQTFQSSTSEAGRLFINLARQFSENAILFDKDEPGSAWSGLLSPSPQAL